MTKTLTRIKPGQPVTDGTTLTGNLNRLPGIEEFAYPIVDSAFDLLKASDELPSVELRDQVSASDLAVLRLYQDVYRIWNAGVVTGSVTGMIENVPHIEPETVTQFGPPAHVEVGESTTGEPRGAPVEEGQTVFVSHTSGIGVGWVNTIALTLPIVFRSSTVIDTRGTLVGGASAISNMRRRHRNDVQVRVRGSEHSQMEADYPNLARALRAGLLEHLTTPLEPRVPHPPEEPLTVDVEWQVRFGANGDAPADGFQRRPPLRNTLFDD
ncbi:MAG: hypothetical protein ACLP8S_07075 [Solirubrobacteraceae bacterium]